MSRKYTKVEQYTEEVFARKAAGETNGEIAESLGLKKEQIKGLVKRQRRKERLAINAYVPRPKGCPKKGCEDAQTQQEKEIARLKMQEVDIMHGEADKISRQRINGSLMQLLNVRKMQSNIWKRQHINITIRSKGTSIRRSQTNFGQQILPISQRLTVCCICVLLWKISLAL